MSSALMARGCETLYVGLRGSRARDAPVDDFFPLDELATAVGIEIAQETFVPLGSRRNRTWSGKSAAGVVN
eukprot:5302274-Amphidinium_carterae.1